MKMQYIVESRKHKGNDLIPNDTKDIVGVFSTPEKALKWIVEHGNEFYSGVLPKNMFWAVLESMPNTGDTGLYAFYDAEGKQIWERMT